MKLHQADRVALGDVPGDLLGEIGLAGARRAVQHDLLAFLQQVYEFLQPRLVHVHLGGQTGRSRGQHGHGRGPRRLDGG